MTFYLNYYYIIDNNYKLLITNNYYPYILKIL